MKVIVADDEKWVRSAIINIIPFDKLGLSLVQEASNGLEALELCNRHMPEILITDIRMPGLTGLELIQEVREALPKTKIIIISGYNDFEYAKAAMKLGVTDYILKPVDEAELIQVLQKMTDTIRVENRLSEEQNFMKSQYKLALPLMHENFLASIIQPNFLTVDVINSTLGKYGICFKLPDFTIALFSPDTPSLKENGPKSKNFKVPFRRVMKHYLSAITFSRSSTDTEVISIINHRHDMDFGHIARALDICGRIYKKRYGTSISIGVSHPARQITKLPDLYTEAREALSTRFWDSPDGVYRYQPDRLSEGLNLKLDDDSLNDMLLNLKLSNYAQVFSYIDDIYSRFSVQKNIKPSIVKEFSWTLLQSLTAKFNIQLSYIEYETSITGIHPYEKIRSTYFFEDLISCIKEMVRHLGAYYNDKNPGAGINIIDTAKKIIEENYYKDISLEQISKLVHLNPTYFSELFKKELGMSFIDYKTLIRVENAKRLLTTTDLNVYEISSKIGYTDSKYFSKLFKKSTGMSPYEYKEKGK